MCVAGNELSATSAGPFRVAIQLCGVFALCSGFCCCGGMAEYIQIEMPSLAVHLTVWPVYGPGQATNSMCRNRGIREYTSIKTRPSPMRKRACFDRFGLKQLTMFYLLLYNVLNYTYYATTQCEVGDKEDRNAQGYLCGIFRVWRTGCE